MSSTTLDYFAGSGTTGHAVINLNREDGGRRKFILVEMGEHFDTVLMPAPQEGRVLAGVEERNGDPAGDRRGGRARAPHHQVLPAGELRGRAEQHRVRGGGRRGALRPGGLHAALHAPVGDQGERYAAERRGAGASLRLHPPAQRERGRGRRWPSTCRRRSTTCSASPFGRGASTTTRAAGYLVLRGTHPRRAQRRGHLARHRGMDAGGPRAGPRLRGRPRHDRRGRTTSG